MQDDHAFTPRHERETTARTLLANEYKRTLAESPYLPVSTPRSALHEECSLVVLVATHIEGESDCRTLAALLAIASRAAADGDVQAQELIEHLARTHARHYAALMNDAGDFA